MNRLSKIFLGLLLCCTVLVSCGDWELRRQMKSFMAQVITLPSELQEIKCGSISPVTITMSNSTMVFFYGNDECSSCAIDHLKDDLLGFVDIEQSGKCKVVVLFSPFRRRFEVWNFIFQYMWISMETFTGSIRISLRTEDSIASCWGRTRILSLSGIRCTGKNCIKYLKRS